MATGQDRRSCRLWAAFLCPRRCKAGLWPQAKPRSSCRLWAYLFPAREMSAAVIPAGDGRRSWARRKTRPGSARRDRGRQPRALREGQGRRTRSSFPSFPRSPVPRRPVVGRRLLSPVKGIKGPLLRRERKAAVPASGRGLSIMGQASADDSARGVRLARSRPGERPVSVPSSLLESRCLPYPSFRFPVLPFPAGSAAPRTALTRARARASCIGLSDGAETDAGRWRSRGL